MRRAAPLLARSASLSAIVLLALLPAAANAQTDSNLGERIARLERALDNKGLLELARQVESLQQEVRQLRGELENQTFALEQVRKGQRDTYLDIDRRLGAVEQGGFSNVAPGESMPGMSPANTLGEPPLPTAPAPAYSGIAGAPAEQSMAVDIEPQDGWSNAEDGFGAADQTPMSVDENGLDVDAAADSLAALAPAPGNMAVRPSTAANNAVLVPSPGSSGNGVDSEAAYAAAFGLLKAGQYEESIAAFNAYMQQYPNSQYADNAQYWLGEAYYVLRQFEPAVAQYQKLVQNYPDSKKQSHAMLKIAYSYYELGLGDQALKVLNELKARFPGSAAARLADERIQRIRSEAN